MTGDERLSHHLDELAPALAALRGHLATLDRWGRELARVLSGGGRLLAVGNGGSAAHAQHLTSELVGRYRDDRRPFSAISLHAEPSALTAIVNDYGPDEAFARQVRAHGRPGDVLVALSTSGRSPNVVAAVDAAHECGLQVWALTGCGPNPVADRADAYLCIDAATTAAVQEIHQIVVHLLCEAFDAEAAALDGASPASIGLDDRGAEATTASSSSGEVVGEPSAGTDGAHGAATVESHPSADRSVGSPSPVRRAGRPDRPHVVVVGDVLLDRDVEGSAGRVCPDAPVPVVDHEGERARPGGAGLSALLAAELRAEVTLVTALGDDPASDRVRGLLDAAGIQVVALPHGGQTAEKIRIRADGQTLVRVDRGAVGVVRVDDDGERAVRDALGRADAVVVADYARGLVNEARVRAALADAAATTPLVWDPHPRGADPVPGAWLVTPNLSEAQRAVPAVPSSPLAAATTAGRALRDRWRARAVAVTLGATGALLVAGDGPPLVSPLDDPATGDVSGAGDAFAVHATVAFARGAVHSEAVAAGVAGGAGFVAHDHRTTWTRMDRNHPVAADHDGTSVAVPADGPVTDDGRVAELLRRMRAAGGTVVMTGGCFDLLHRGHVQLLRHARTLGDCLVVCLNADDSVRRLKGPTRPVVTAEDRARVLLALECVDDVVIFDEDTPVEVLGRFRPDLFVKGGDYGGAELPETEVLRRWGGQVVIVPYVDGHSTTRMLQEVRTDG